MSFEWLDETIKLATAWGMTAIGGIALMVAGMLIARLLRKGLRHALHRIRLDEQLVGLIASIAYYFAVAVILIVAFGVMGIETASLITILGTCTLAIGLALQGSLSNFASGLMLLVFRPFREGDFIETGEFMGRVTDLGVFSTTVDTLRNISVNIPNTYIAQRPLQNWTRNGHCRLDLTIEVAIDSDLDRVKAAIARMLGAEARVLADPAPFVGIANFGDTSAQMVIHARCRLADYWTLQLELPEAIKTAVEAADATMPTPRRDIVLIGAGQTAATPQPA